MAERGAAPAGAVSQTASSGGPDKSAHRHYERLSQADLKGGAPAPDYDPGLGQRAMSPTAWRGQGREKHPSGRPRPERGGRVQKSPRRALRRAPLFGLPGLAFIERPPPLAFSRGTRMKGKRHSPARMRAREGERMCLPAPSMPPTHCHPRPRVRPSAGPRTGSSGDPVTTADAGTCSDGATRILPRSR